MSNILDRIVEQKKLDISAAKKAVSEVDLKDQLSRAPLVRDFLGAIDADARVSLIAEVKKASPSQGVIREDFDPVMIARAYQGSGATCISVLTDENFFQGRLDYLTAIRREIELPVLRKDFILDPYQVLEARAAGADAVLLIAECLSPNQLVELHDHVVSFGMTPLVEFYDPKNLDAVLACGAKLIGVNNRDLTSFETDLNHCVRMRALIPATISVVGESGIFIADDVSLLASAKIDAMLVGESLMRSADIGAAVKALLSDQTKA